MDTKPSLSRRSFLRHTAAATFAASSIFPADALSAFTNDAEIKSALSASTYLKAVMDAYHETFGVYTDVSAAGNHFHAYGKIPDANANVTVNGSWTDNPHSGATCIRCEFGPPKFGGFYFLNGKLGPTDRSPTPVFGTEPDVGVSLTGAMFLTFWARGEHGGEVVEFFCSGVGRDAKKGTPITPFPDSGRVVKVKVRLTKKWHRYRLRLKNANLDYLQGGFGWVCAAEHNPGGAIFYVDDIAYELTRVAKGARLQLPRFLRSFTTLPLQPDPFDSNTADDFDFVLRNTAFSYDNALALLAFLALGDADSLRRARLIGDAFLYAATHDRLFSDGRVRDAYAAGDIALPPGWNANGRTFTTPEPGFYYENSQTFYEILQSAISVGNNAWVMISLLALYKRTSNVPYLSAARQIGEFIQQFRQTTGTYQGFRGGFEGAETNPQPVPWASSEHNIDIYAAFTVMAAITHEQIWQDDAAHARAFVESMWDQSRQCFLTGTVNSETRNSAPGQLPVDVQAWSVLALPNLLDMFPNLLACAEANHATTADGFTGFDFNEDRDGVWFEGIAHMATAYAAVGDESKAEVLRAMLRRAQTELGGGQAMPAASHDGVTSGFGFNLFNRYHVGATAWHIFAQLRVNPYYL